MRRHKISLSEIEIPENGFQSFNDFFTRKRRAIPLEFDAKSLYSPCDGFLNCFPINSQSVFSIKHTEYSLAELLQNKDLAEHFQDGIAMVFRLAPQNYHRYIFAASGSQFHHAYIPGKYHCVRPIATEKFPVYIQNAREFGVYSSEAFGSFVQMEVGALLVGKIHNHNSSSDASVGTEKGYFEYGGSSIVLLFERNSILIKKELSERLTDNGIPVIQGELLGISADSQKITY